MHVIQANYSLLILNQLKLIVVISNLSHYRIYFPWEYNNGTADKFIVTASWPCLSPTAVYASGNYVYWDIYGNDNCPGTLQGVIWYGDDCEDEDGNIGFK